MSLQPIQVWLPQLVSTLGRDGAERDKQRAYTAWDRETSVWLLPDLKEPRLWREFLKGTEFKDRVRAIPAEHLDRVDIYHVGRNGCIHGPRARKSRFPGNTVSGLLETFLDIPRKNPIELHLAPQQIPAILPRILEGKLVYYVESSITLTPTSVMPIASFDDESGTVISKWPPDEWYRSVVSPDVESSVMFGPLKWDDLAGIPIAVSERDPNVRSLPLLLKWPSPIHWLMSLYDGGDLMHGLLEVQTLALESQSDPKGALAQAREAAARYVTPGSTTRLLGWFLPLRMQGEKYARSGLDACFDIDETPGLEALKRDDIQKALNEKMVVHRAWGVIGLLWSLLLQRLESGARFRPCELCGRTIQGAKAKRFCSLEDDPDCHRRREAAYQRKSRHGQGDA